MSLRKEEIQTLSLRSSSDNVSSTLTLADARFHQRLQLEEAVWLSKAVSFYELDFGYISVYAHNY